MEKAKRMLTVGVAAMVFAGLLLPLGVVMGGMYVYRFLEKRRMV